MNTLTPEQKERFRALIKHPEAVAQMAKDAGIDPRQNTAALLHLLAKAGKL